MWSQRVGTHGRTEHGKSHRECMLCSWGSDTGRGTPCACTCTQTWLCTQACLTQLHTCAHTYMCAHTSTLTHMDIHVHTMHRHIHTCHVHTCARSVACAPLGLNCLPSCSCSCSCCRQVGAPRHSRQPAPGQDAQLCWSPVFGAPGQGTRQGILFALHALTTVGPRALAAPPGSRSCTETLLGGSSLVLEDPPPPETRRVP